MYVLLIVCVQTYLHLSLYIYIYIQSFVLGGLTHLFDIPFLFTSESNNQTARGTHSGVESLNNIRTN